MAGGTFETNILDPKTLPGTYINFESGRPETFEEQERGIVLLPLLNTDYGPSRKFIEITNANLSEVIPLLGRDVRTPQYHMQLIRQALLGASKVLAYIPAEGTKASAKIGERLQATAMYAGSRGNDITVAVIPDPMGGFDVEIFVENDRVEQFTGLETAEQLIESGSEWVKFAGTGDLEEVAGVHLEGGTNGTVRNADIMHFLDDSESETWTTMGFPADANVPRASDAQEMLSIMQAINSKITYLREECGKYRRAVVANYAANNDSIINVTNGVVLSDGTEVPEADAVAWVAGIDAGASNTTSNTYKFYPDAVAVLKPKNTEAAKRGIKAGEFFFIRDDKGNVKVQKDINSLTNFRKPRDKSYSFNRVMRVFDTYAESLQVRFQPNTYDNSPEGWALMEGVGQTLLADFEDNKIIKNVDPTADFFVEQDKSDLDYTYFGVRLQPIMSTEKFYFSIRTY